MLTRGSWWALEASCAARQGVYTTRLVCHTPGRTRVRSKKACSTIMSAADPKVVLSSPLPCWAMSGALGALVGGGRGANVARILDANQPCVPESSGPKCGARECPRFRARSKDSLLNETTQRRKKAPGCRVNLNAPAQFDAEDRQSHVRNNETPVTTHGCARAHNLRGKPGPAGDDASQGPQAQPKTEKF